MNVESRIIELLVTAGYVSEETVEKARKLALSLKWDDGQAAQHSVQRIGGTCPHCRRPVQDVKYCEACGPVAANR